MNYGAYLIDPEFLSQDDISALTALALTSQGRSIPTHDSGKYASDLWSFVPLVLADGSIPDNVETIEVKRVISFFKTRINMAVFYYLEPGGTLHPHRDMTGAKLNDRIRFHIPIRTNDNVFFRVSGERIIMGPGTFWALDTSYLHSVENVGSETRIHIVIECDINQWCRSIMAKPNWKTRFHDVFYAGYLAFAVVKSLAINSWKDPAYLKAQIGMGIRFVKWRASGLLRRLR